MPLNGRNYLSLIALSPNVSAGFAGPGQAGDRQGGSRANQQISISGQRREFNYYTLDGVDNTDVNFNTYIFSAVGRRARGIQSADRHLFG